MLKKTDLFELVHSLNASEKKYIFANAKKSGDGDNEYVLIIKELLKMDEYSEEYLKKKFSKHSFVKQSDVKKHYLFHWILRQLSAFHFKKYPVQNRLNETDILIDKSLYNVAYRLMVPLKEELKSREDYLSLLILLEKELTVARFVSLVNSESALEELKFYSKAYSDYQAFQSVKYKLRKRLERYVFVRNDNDLIKLKQIISSPVMEPERPPAGVRNNFLYNLNYYWFYACSENWELAYNFALRNFRIVTDRANSAIEFTDEVVLAFYNVLISSIISGNLTMYNRVLNRLKKLAGETKSERVRSEALFSFHLVQLIFTNKQGEHKDIGGVISAAEKFIETSAAKFDSKRRNNYYFDLAKAYLLTKDFNKPFKILKNIVENTGEKDNSIDFICFSKILYCLTCYERNDIELMLHSARSATYFLQKYNSYFDFEKRLLRFIRYELPGIELQSREEQKQRFVSLKKDILSLFGKEYGKTAMVYFNFIKWIDGKIKEPLPAAAGKG